jgi:hypothetical protein
MKNNTTILGFTSLNDLLVTTFQFKVGNITTALLFSLSGFITEYVYDDVKAVYWMLFMAGLDFLTGIAKAFKQKNFSSARLPRMLIIILIYCLLLSMGWNMAKFSPIYNFLPGLIYGALVSTLFISIIENLRILKLIPKSLFTSISDAFKRK